MCGLLPHAWLLREPMSSSVPGLPNLSQRLKANVEISSRYDGVVRKIHWDVGDMVQVRILRSRYTRQVFSRTLSWDCKARVRLKIAG